MTIKALEDLTAASTLQPPRLPLHLPKLHLWATNWPGCNGPKHCAHTSLRGTFHPFLLGLLPQLVHQASSSIHYFLFATTHPLPHPFMAWPFLCFLHTPFQQLSYSVTVGSISIPSSLKASTISFCLVFLSCQCQAKYLHNRRHLLTVITRMGEKFPWQLTLSFIITINIRKHTLCGHKRRLDFGW